MRNNIGYALHQLGRYDEALDQFRQTVVLRERGGDRESIRSAHWMVGWTLRAMNRVDEALAIQLRLREHEVDGKPDPYVFEELALLYRAKGDAAQADHYAALKDAASKRASSNAASFIDGCDRRCLNGTRSIHDTPPDRLRLDLCSRSRLSTRCGRRNARQLKCDTMYLNQSHQEVIMAASTTTMVHVRVDENIKAQATETLASMGLTVSDAIRVFLTRVVADKELPFAIKAPNANSRSAMAETGEIIKSRGARFATADALIDDIEKTSRK